MLTHRLLLQRVWGPEYGSEGNYLHVYVAGLRKKLEADPGTPSTCSPSPAWATASAPTRLKHFLSWLRHSLS